MIAAILKENIQGETRVAATPKTVKELIDNGLQLRVQSGAGESSFHSDQAYKDAGAEITPDVTSTLNGANIVLKVSPLTLDEVDALDEGSIYVSLLQTTKEIDLVKRLTEKKVTGFSMHLIPRTTLAQSMDALSSQANIAGYKSVLVGAAHLAVYMPLLMTAAGTIPPAKVLIVGAGVAGLQAIATANRLGAQVEAFDVRPEVKEQVKSLGAKFIEIESQDKEGVGDGGYAKETSDDYKKQQELKIKERTAKSDLVITTALIPGKPAPVLINKDIVENMKRGSVIVDLASENGGNCELTQKDKVVNHNGVIIDGTSNFIHGIPHVGIVIGKIVNNEITDGIIFNPILNEFYWASNGKGAWCNNKRIRVSKRQELSSCLIGTGAPFGERIYVNSSKELENISKLTAGVRRLGAASLDLAYVASGKIDGFWENDLNLWDVCSGVLLVKEAGGRVSEPEGSSWTTKSRNILVSNTLIHKKLIENLTLL